MCANCTRPDPLLIRCAPFGMRRIENGRRSRPRGSLRLFAVMSVATRNRGSSQWNFANSSPRLRDDGSSSSRSSSLGPFWRRGCLRGDAGLFGQLANLHLHPGEQLRGGVPGRNVLCAACDVLRRAGQRRLGPHQGHQPSWSLADPGRALQECLGHRQHEHGRHRHHRQSWLPRPGAAHRRDRRRRDDQPRGSTRASPGPGRAASRPGTCRRQGVLQLVSDQPQHPAQRRRRRHPRTAHRPCWRSLARAARHVSQLCRRGSRIRRAPPCWSLSRKTAPSRSTRLVSDPQGSREIAEAFRVLRTNLQFVNVDAEMRCIVVSSALANEGKTMSAANLSVLAGPERCLGASHRLRLPQPADAAAARPRAVRRPFHGSPRPGVAQRSSADAHERHLVPCHGSRTPQPRRGPSDAGHA